MKEGLGSGGGGWTRENTGTSRLGPGGMQARGCDDREVMATLFFFNFFCASLRLASII